MCILLMIYETPTIFTHFILIAFWIREGLSSLILHLKSIHYIWSSYFDILFCMKSEYSEIHLDAGRKVWCQCTFCDQMSPCLNLTFAWIWFQESFTCHQEAFLFSLLYATIFRVKSKYIYTTLPSMSVYFITHSVSGLFCFSNI